MIALPGTTTSSDVPLAATAVGSGRTRTVAVIVGEPEHHVARQRSNPAPSIVIDFPGSPTPRRVRRCPDVAVDDRAVAVTPYKRWSPPASSPSADRNPSPSAPPSSRSGSSPSEYTSSGYGPEVRSAIRGAAKAHRCRPPRSPLPVRWMQSVVVGWPFGLSGPEPTIGPPEGKPAVLAVPDGPYPARRAAGTTTMQAPSIGRRPAVGFTAIS